MPGQYNLSVLFFSISGFHRQAALFTACISGQSLLQDRLAAAAAVTVGGIMEKCRFFLHKPMS